MTPSLQHSNPMPLHCRSAYALGDSPPDWIMWMPGGRHVIRARKGDAEIEVSLDIGAEDAATMQAILARYFEKGLKPYLDFDHREAEASAWPLAFEWRETPRPGIYCKVEWSKPGAEAITGKTFRSFSPTFFETNTKPARVLGAPLCMGGLVNEPAFSDISPLWARDATTNNPQPAASAAKENRNMKVKLIRARGGNAAGAIVELAGDELVAALDNGDAITLAADDALKAKDAKIQEQAEAIKARAKQDAETKVAEAVKAGKIKGDDALKTRWVEMILADPKNAELLDALPAADDGSQRITQPVTTKASAVEIPYGQLAPIEDALKGYTEEKNPKRRAAIYAREFSPRAQRDEMIPIRCANVLGTVAADLITQRRLELLVDTLPILTRIARNFSDTALKFGKTAYAQKIGVLTPVAYVAGTGWPNVDVSVSDITVTLNKRMGIQITFHQEELSGTTRRLFTEQEEAQVYALGKAITDDLYALITADNFPTAGTACALADFARVKLPEFADLLDTAKAPDYARSFILKNDFYNKLTEDSSIVSIALPESQRAMQTGKLPMLSGFEMIKATNLPSTANLKGFALFADALAMVTSPDEDYINAIPGVPATALLQTVTEPRTGISVTLVKFTDHKLAAAYQRASLVYGVAKGDSTLGVRLVTP